MEKTRLHRLKEFFGLVFPHSNRRKKFRAAWGLVGEKDGWLAGRSFDLGRTESKALWMDDKTWADLEFPKVFSDLDSTVTPLGGQYLYKQLRKYELDADVMSRRCESYDELRTNQALREELQLILVGLEADSAAYIADAVLGPPLDTPKYPLLISALSVLSVVALVAVIAFAVTPWLWIGVVAMNVVVLVTASQKARRGADALMNCARMLGVADRLAAVRAEREIVQLAELRADRQKRAKLRGQARWLSLASIDSTLLAGLAVAANVCFLTKLVAYTHAANRFSRSRQEWVSTFELIGSIDAAIAVASYLHRTPKHCRPTVTSDPLIAFEDAYHPLLLKPVENSVNLDKRSALVTGSNMAGKTTFVKTIGTNIVFGHTLGVCLAASATIPRSSVMASIRGEQSVESGNSRYFSEVRSIIGFIETLSRGECRVFVIDELFSGTNTVERIAVAKAVLDTLSEDAQILVTTHDVELQHLLPKHFDLFHFQENPNVEGFFDYKLRAGISSERNAIRVLERMGFPHKIVQEALAQVGRTVA
jgi:hypothetical protein